jgi:hypothetical protein
LQPGLQVRYVVAMPGMAAESYPAKPIAQGWYRGLITFPMAGSVDVAIQVQKGSTWRQVRLLRYRVDTAGAAQPLGVASPRATALPR